MSGQGWSGRRRALPALVLALALLLALVAGARADLVSGPYLDPPGDTGSDPAAVDVLATTAVHVEHDDETSVDDEVRLSSLVRAPFNQVLFARSGDSITWFINSDGHIGTGENNLAGAVGAERQVVVFKGSNGPAGEIRRWTGLAFEVMRPLAGAELTVGAADGQGAQQVTVEVPMADLALPRGVVATFAVRSAFGAVADRAPATGGHQFAITPPPPPSNVPSAPRVGTTAATGIRQDGITVSGLVNPGGLPTKFHFEYGLTAAYGLQSPPQDVVLDPNSPTYPVALVQRFLGPLEHGATYHYRLVATNSLGTGASVDNTFKLQDPRPPEVADLVAADITQTSATVSASLDPNGAVTTYFFEYGQQDAPTPVQTPSKLSPSTAPAAGLIVTETLTDLRPATTYRYTLVATSRFGGPIRTATLTFTTLPILAPAVETTPASEMRETSATLNGVVDPNGLPATYRFEYGETSSYELGTASSGQTGAGDAPVPIAGTVTDLKRETIYHFRVVAESAAGITASEDRTFVTASPPPATASTGRPRAIGQRTAVLTGRVGTTVEGTAYFEWGIGSRFNRRTAAQPVSEAGPIRATLRGLARGTEYTYRLVVETPGGREAGEGLPFRTQAADQIRARPVPLQECRASRRTCVLTSFTLPVQVVAGDGSTVTRAAAARGIRVRLWCSSGCSLRSRFTLRAGRQRLEDIAGRSVPITIARSSGRLTADLRPLFGGRALPFGAVINVAATKAGIVSGGGRFRVGFSPQTRICDVSGDRLIRCRRPT